MASRRERRLQRYFDKRWRCLEIGPSYNPLLPKRGGWDTLSVDHADRATLVAKYAGSGVDTAAIEEVDVVWTAGPLELAVPAALHGSFDACVASHVIEHVPNPIGFFQALSKLLKPDGRLVLAVPDKRYCFDYFRTLTSTGDWLCAWKRGASVHAARNVFEHEARAVRADGRVTWGRWHRPGKLEPLRADLRASFQRFLACYDGPRQSYSDCHAWQFTPSSFALIMLELAQLELLGFSLDVLKPQPGCEFFAVLRNRSSPPLPNARVNRRRVALMRRCLREQAAQARGLSGPLRNLPRRAARRVFVALRGR